MKNESKRLPRCPEHVKGARVCWHELVPEGRCRLLIDTEFGDRDCPFRTLSIDFPDPDYAGGRIAIEGGKT